MVKIGEVVLSSDFENFEVLTKVHKKNLSENSPLQPPLPRQNG